MYVWKLKVDTTKQWECMASLIHNVGKTGLLFGGKKWIYT